MVIRLLYLIPIMLVFLFFSVIDRVLMRFTRWDLGMEHPIETKRVKFMGTFGSNEHVPNYLLDPKQLDLYDSAVPQWYFAWSCIYSAFCWHFKFRGKIVKLKVGTSNLSPSDILTDSRYITVPVIVLRRLP